MICSSYGLSPAAIKRIRSAIDKLAVAAAASNTDAVAEADLDVVTSIVAEAGSPVLALCMNPVSAVLRELPQLRVAMYRDPERNVESFRAVLAWMTTRRADLIDAILGELEGHDRATVQALTPKKTKSTKANR